MEQVTMINITMYKFVLDFQKILRPNDSEVQYRYNKFHDCYDYCSCPLLRDSLNPHVSIIYYFIIYTLIKYKYNKNKKTVNFKSIRILLIYW